MSGVGSPLVACRRRVAPRRSLGSIVVRATCAATVARGRSSFRPQLVMRKRVSFSTKVTVSFAHGRVGRVGAASHMSGVGSPLVACRRRVAPRRSLGSIVVRATCAATVARGALVVSTAARDGKRVSFSTEVTVVRAWACRSRRRCLSHERRRLTTRCMSTTCRSTALARVDRRSRHLCRDGRSGSARRFDRSS